MIVDAGGGTVDLSTYQFVTANPISVEEISAPDCRLLSAHHIARVINVGCRYTAGLYESEHARFRIFERCFILHAFHIRL